MKHNPFQRKTIVLVSCASQKLDGVRRAADLYTSPLFKKSLALAQRIAPEQDIYILSAKHHLLPLDKRIASYDLYLADLSSSDRMKWAQQVLAQINTAGYDVQNDGFIILAGRDYYQYLLGPNGIQHYILPLEGLKIGYSMQKLDKLMQLTQNELMREIGL